MQYNRDFMTVSNSSTIAQWVDAYNNNALAGSDIVFMMGEATFSSVLYTGLETVGNGTNSYRMESFKDVAPDFNAVFPDNLVLDNWYCYFRNINKFILVSQLHVDLTDYSKYDNDEFVQGDLYHFFLNYQLGYRISHSPIPKEGETRLFRFVANDRTISQLIPTFPRYFYSGNNVDYEDITGLDVRPANAVSLGVNDGWVDYDGITFDFHPIPDKKWYTESLTEGFELVSTGSGYMVDDIIGTNDPSQNFRVTEVKNEVSESNAWNEFTNYIEGNIVYYNKYTWIAQADNIGEEPGTSGSWKQDALAGVIINGEITTDPIEIQLDGSGAVINLGQVTAPWPLLYNTTENKLDYSRVTQAVDGSLIMDYSNNTQTSLGANQYSIQRVHLDYLKDILVVQYGNTAFNSMKEALDAVYTLSFPFVYNTYIFPVLAYMIVRSDYTDLNDPEQCQIIQIHTHSIDIRESENLATDSYARSILNQHTQQIQILNDWLTRLQNQVDGLGTNFDLHISNNLPSPQSIKTGTNQNPHRVTKAEVGLGEVDNVAMKDMPVPPTGGTTGLVHVREELDKVLASAKSYTDSSATSVLTTAGQRFLYKDRNDSTNSGVATVIDNLMTRGNHMKFRASGYDESSGVDWYVGELPANPPAQNNYGVKRS